MPLALGARGLGYALNSSSLCRCCVRSGRTRRSAPQYRTIQYVVGAWEADQATECADQNGGHGTTTVSGSAPDGNGHCVAHIVVSPCTSGCTATVSFGFEIRTGDYCGTTPPDVCAASTGQAKTRNFTLAWVKNPNAADVDEPSNVVGDYVGPHFNDSLCVDGLRAYDAELGEWNAGLCESGAGGQWFVQAVCRCHPQERRDEL